MSDSPENPDFDSRADRDLPLAVGQVARRTSLRLLILALFGLLLVLSLPVWRPKLIGAGLDASWLATLHHFALSEKQFGIDLVFTYGPLGFLQKPFFDPDTYLLQIAFYLAVALALMTAAWGLFSPGKGEVASPWLLALLFLLPLYVRRPDSLLFLTAGAFLLRRGCCRPAGIHLGDLPFLLVLSLSCLGKFVHLATAVLTVGVAALIELLQGRKIPRLPVLFIGLILLWLHLTHQRLSSLPEFLDTARELILGYPEVLGSFGPPPEALITATACTLFLAILLWSRIPNDLRTRLALSMGLAGILSLVFKLRLLRLGRGSLVTEVLVGIGVFYAGHTLASKGSKRARLGGLLALLTALGAHLFSVTAAEKLDLVPYHVAEIKRIRRSARGLLGGTLLPPFETLKEASEKGKEELRRRYPLPALPGTVDLFGSLQAVVVSHGLDFSPRPVFQPQHAYTSRLATLNGDFYRSPQAPRFVLAKVDTFKGFPPSTLDSRAFLELLQSYRLVRQTNDFLILARGKTQPFDFRLLLEETVPLGRTLDLAAYPSSSLLWIEIELRKTLVGSIAALAWRPKWLRIDCTLADGETFSWHLASRAVKGGFLLSPLILDNEHLSVLLRGETEEWKTRRSVRALAFHETKPGSRHYERQVHLRLYELSPIGALRRGGYPAGNPRIGSDPRRADQSPK